MGSEALQQCQLNPVLFWYCTFVANVHLLCQYSHRQGLKPLFSCDRRQTMCRFCKHSPNLPFKRTVPVSLNMEKWSNAFDIYNSAQLPWDNKICLICFKLTMQDFIKVLKQDFCTNWSWFTNHYSSNKKQQNCMHPVEPGDIAI